MWLAVIFASLTVGPVATGNLLLGKPSTDPMGNDGTDQCFFSDTSPTPYWQVDLQGYYSIHNVSVITCWGSWGTLAKSAAIEVYHSDPGNCSDGESFRYGMTPSNTGATQTHSFQASPPFSVRYLRVFATSQTALSLGDVAAFGSVAPNKNVVFYRASAKRRLTRVSSKTTVSSRIGCGRECYMAGICLAFSFRSNATPNCILSDCPSASDEVTGESVFDILD